MNKKTKILLIALGLVVLMAVPAFASQGVLGNHKFSWGTGRQSNIEIIAEKTGVPVEKLLERRELGSNCKDFLDDHGLSLEDVKKARLEQQFKKVDERIEAGDITEEEGKTIKEKIQSYRFLQDCNGPHHGEREGMKLNLKRMKNDCEQEGNNFGQMKHNHGRVKNNHRQCPELEK